MEIDQATVDKARALGDAIIDVINASDDRSNLTVLVMALGGSIACLASVHPQPLRALKLIADRVSAYAKATVEHNLKDLQTEGTLH